MARFLKDEDYFQIKGEILKLLDGSTAELAGNYKLLKAENAAIKQIRNRLSNRFDCDLIFTPFTDEPDTRDAFIVMMAVDMTLYHLYSQTGNRDVPEHRKERYQDALDFLKDASLGEIPTDLPSILSDENQGDVRMWSAKEPENHDW